MKHLAGEREDSDRVLPVGRVGHDPRGGFPDPLAAGPLPRFLNSILDEHPRVHVRLRVLPFDQINEGYDAMRNHTNIRGLVLYD